MGNLRRLARSLNLAAVIACALATDAYAQADEGDEIITPGGVLPAGTASTYNSGDQLAANLKLLAQNPRNVAALTQAGASALAAGDASAALGFLARADEINPSSPRVKQLLGSALIQLERPEDGLRLFAESAAIGGLTREILRDRGLAFDLRGDPRRAQADYAEALKRGADDEVARRYALSLGATGDREQALRLLEPLIRKQDQAAWRARAFVMAMTGDLRSAERIVAEVMPSNLVGTLGNFMRRLPNLTPAQRAAAVNFGTMPAEGPQYALVSQTEALRPITGQAAQNLSRPTAPVQIASATAPTGKQEKLSKREKRKNSRDRGTQVALAQPTVSLPPVAPRPVNTRPGFSTPAPAPAPVAIAPKPAAQPVVPDNRQGARVGQRIGPVDTALLPPQIRPALPVAPTAQVISAAPVPIAPAPVAQAPAAIPPVQVAVVALPPVAPAPATTPSISLPAVTPAPKPLFEIPSTKVDTAPIRVAAVVPAPAIPADSVTLVPATATIALPAATTATPSVALPTLASSASVPAPIAPPPSPTVNAPSLVAQTPAVAARPNETTPRPSVIISSQPVIATGPSLAEAGLPSRLIETTGAVQPSGSSITNVAPGSTEAATLPTATVVREVSLSAPGAVGSNATGVALPVTTAAPVNGTNLPTTPFTQIAAAQSAPAVPDQPRGLADVIGSIETEEESRAGDILTDAEFRRARLAAKRKAELEDAAKLAKDKSRQEEESAAAVKAKAKAAEEEEARQLAKRNPARVWVQIATGANRSGLPGTWSRLKEKGGDVLKGKSAASVPFKSTNRLLVGPYKSQTEARATVNRLATKGIQATTFSSGAGEEVSAIGGR